MVQDIRSLGTIPTAWAENEEDEVEIFYSGGLMLICTNCGGDLVLIAIGYDEKTDKDYEVYRCKQCGTVEIRFVGGNGDLQQLWSFDDGVDPVRA